MKLNIIEFVDNDLFVGTWKLSHFFEVEHRSLKRTIQNNIKDIIEVGEIEPKIRPLLENTIPKKKGQNKLKKGPPIEEYLLNEPQATFVILLLKGHYKTDRISKVVQFKKHLTEMFFKQRKLLGKLLVQKQNIEWLVKRESGKIERRLETDMIKAFVEYSKKQGSKNADKYYMIISKMENQFLFHLDYIAQQIPNIRDIAEGFQLDTLKIADRIVAKAIKEGMESKMPYKEIFQLSKQRVWQYAEVLGKTPLQLALQ